MFILFLAIAFVLSVANLTGVLAVSWWVIFAIAVAYPVIAIGLMAMIAIGLTVSFKKGKK